MPKSELLRVRTNVNMAYRELVEAKEKLDSIVIGTDKEEILNFYKTFNDDLIELISEVDDKYSTLDGFIGNL